MSVPLPVPLSAPFVWILPFLRPLQPFRDGLHHPPQADFAHCGCNKHASSPAYNLSCPMRTQSSSAGQLHCLRLLGWCQPIDPPLVAALPEDGLQSTARASWRHACLVLGGPRGMGSGAIWCLGKRPKCCTRNMVEDDGDGQW